MKERSIEFHGRPALVETVEGSITPGAQPAYRSRLEFTSKDTRRLYVLSFYSPYLKRASLKSLRKIWNGFLESWAFLNSADG